jgi:hypothetical protein
MYLWTPIRRTFALPIHPQAKALNAQRSGGRTLDVMVNRAISAGMNATGMDWDEGADCPISAIGIRPQRWIT